MSAWRIGSSATASLTPAKNAVDVEAQRSALGFVADTLADRAERCAVLSKPENDALRTKLRGRVDDLLDEWCRIAASKRAVGATLQYQR